MTDERGCIAANRRGAENLAAEGRKAFKSSQDDGIGVADHLEGQARMARRFRKSIGVRIGAGLVGVALAGVAGCGDSFSSSCVETRSCAPSEPGEAGATGDSEPGGTATGGGGSAQSGNGGSAGNPDDDGGSDAGGKPMGPCTAAMECSNGDATDGEEQCVAGACKPGDAPPFVVSISPADGADDAEPDATVEIMFSEPLDSTSVTTDTVKVFAGDDEVAGTVDLLRTRKQVTFTPDQPFDLWATYRVELSHEIRDVAGPLMLEDVSSSFQVRDGVWSVTNLATRATFELPPALPIAPSGALLTTWLATNESECGAHGTWMQRGEAGARFDAHLSELDCSDVFASIAPDGSAIAAWAQTDAIWTQSFDGSSWAAADREGRAVGDDLRNLRAFAHEGLRTTMVLDLNHATNFRNVATGPARGSWTESSASTFPGLGPHKAALGWDGGPLAWSDARGLHVIGYDPKTNAWDAAPTNLPGFTTAILSRSVLNVVTSKDGDVVILWVEGSSDQVLRSSRFRPATGWEEPINVNTGLAGEPLFDAPALVFDGETFVSGWAAVTGGKWTTYTSRYDMDSGKWGEREAHVSDVGESVALMPRLGVDSQHNLMLVWAVGDDALALVYQRYHAASETWGDIQAIPKASFTDSELTTAGRLPFGFAKNGLGGIVFRSGTAGSQTLKLASFF